MPLSFVPFSLWEFIFNAYRNKYRNYAYPFPVKKTYS